MSEGPWFVCYEVMGRKLASGPYEKEDIAEDIRRDIAGYEGVRGCWVTDVPPDDYERIG